MNFRIWAPVLGIFCSVFAASVQAESAQQADYIVAVVNSEPITNHEVLTAMQRVAHDMTQQHQAIPPASELKRRVLERLINERAQLQLANEMGLRVEESQIDQAEQAVARQNQIEVPELRQRVAKDGLTTAQFRSQLRDQLLMQRLQEREVDKKIQVTESDIDHYLDDQKASNNDPLAQEVNLANLLVSVPEKANAEQVAALQLQAQKTLSRLRAGEDFSALVQELSAADRTNGGQMGLRRGDRYPPAFLAATQNLPVGGVSEIVRSGAGFHILKVVERRAPTEPTKAFTQSHARHILLRVTPQLTQAAAIARLTEYRKRIEKGGSALFQSLAREHSEDGSAAQGGDLGWVSPGAFVPEFEEAMNRLSEGQISGPVVSRFGVHLIEMVERRRVELSPREIREAIRNQLKEGRYEAAFTAWAQEVRGNAFVEFREPPQ